MLSLVACCQFSWDRQDLTTTTGSSLIRVDQRQSLVFASHNPSTAGAPRTAEAQLGQSPAKTE